MQNYITNAGGYLTNPDATSDCQFCSVRTTDQFLGPSFNIAYSHHWRNLGFLMAFILFNVSVPHILVVVEQIEKYIIVGRLPLYLHIYIPHPHKQPPSLAEETIHSQKCLERNGNEQLSRYFFVNNEVSCFSVRGKKERHRASVYVMYRPTSDICNNMED